MKHPVVDQARAPRGATPAASARDSTIPRHVAIIMDGNRRWAAQRGLPQMMGHASGARRIRPLVERCMAVGIECLTLFAFSTENWRRPEQEVSGLTKLFLRYLRKEAGDLHLRGIRLKIIGDVSRFDQPLRQLFEEVEHLTRENTGLTLAVAVNYGGRWDMLNAMRRWIQAHPGACPESMDEDALAPYFSTAGLPDPDLLIRTGGEVRVSNFMLWQMAYTEMYFTDVLFPAFNVQRLDESLTWFAGRNRRFGASDPPPSEPDLRAAASA
ncbi:polyprenyl diphosphate synthase [Xylophilus sp. GOD-11R]|uniref:polyprenyl diphosphate synthase n=1 Tax=Xylophilus sp. GOD-11R TaxID=3089814 RepID=UPI00298C2854|nr:polyprenyl diphosphate synthase [Xylophilus sp. GOD-11R]WPB58069.1 polyprenyl diphosphate synthase [Xylophilus sp. GOD-11R]